MSPRMLDLNCRQAGTATVGRQAGTSTKAEDKIKLAAKDSNVAEGRAEEQQATVR